MTTTTKPLFGGKSFKALPWHPLPHMEEYIDNLTVDDTSLGYIRAARVALAHFAIFCQAEGIQHPDEVERPHLLRFQTYLSTLRNQRTGKPLAKTYQRQLLKYIGTWFGWLVGLEYVTATPWVRIKVGRDKKHPKPLEDEEIVALFDAHRLQAFSISPFMYHRREVVLVLLFGWGLRIHELAALTVTGMDTRQEFVTCINKGGGTKQLPYGDEMKKVVLRWLTHRSMKAVREVDRLLIDSSGNPLSTAMIYKIVTECGARGGVMVNPHRLRDTFATKLLDENVEVGRIMKMMGHTSREQTMAYARVNDHTLKTSHDSVMNPIIHSLITGKPRKVGQ